MEIRNILRTGYKVLVVTVTLIEAIDLGKNLIGKLEGIATLLKGIKKLQGVIVKLLESREPP